MPARDIRSRTTEAQNREVEVRVEEMGFALKLEETPVYLNDIFLRYLSRVSEALLRL